ncbi:MAG: hypothetical protein ACFFAY_16430 [Promethearchaeota archaeon]
MVDFPSLHKSARHDVRMCIQAWADVLRETLGNRIDYVYSKGSSCKKWDSPIDYVPVLSDVDIHICLKDNDWFFAESELPFEDAMDLSRKFEERFFELESDPLHFPRSQLIHVNEFMQKNERFIPPIIEHVHPVIGVPKRMPFPSVENARKWDKENVLELEEYLKEVSMSVVDRAGFDFWSQIRRICWRVSPMPVRLITQIHENPYEVWTWNRTQIATKLGEMGLADIERLYRDYYMAGWRLFLSEFRNRHEFREVVHNGLRLLNECLKQVKTM